MEQEQLLYAWFDPRVRYICPNDQMKDLTEYYLR